MLSKRRRFVPRIESKEGGGQGKERKENEKRKWNESVACSSLTNRSRRKRGERKKKRGGFDVGVGEKRGYSRLFTDNCFKGSNRLPDYDRHTLIWPDLYNIIG